MISVGIDVSKEKSTICILKPYEEIVCSPFEIQHMEKDLKGFHNLLEKLDGEIRIVMEATGIYHLPVLTFLHDKFKLRSSQKQQDSLLRLYELLL